MNQRQATSPMRLKAQLHTIQRASGGAYKIVLANTDTQETPIPTIATRNTRDDLPAVGADGECIVTMSLLNPHVVSFPRELLLAYLKIIYVGRELRQPSGLYRIEDLTYHPYDPTRIVARVSPLGRHS